MHQTLTIWPLTRGPYRDHFCQEWSKSSQSFRRCPLKPWQKTDIQPSQKFTITLRWTKIMMLKIRETQKCHVHVEPQNFDACLIWFFMSNQQYFSYSSVEKLKSEKYFPSLTNCLFTFIQKNNCVFICVHKTLFSIDLTSVVYWSSYTYTVHWTWIDQSSSCSWAFNRYTIDGFDKRER